MTDHSVIPRCARCGDRIGVYERLWLQREDGGIVPASILALRNEGLDTLGVSLWHLACLPPDRTPSGGGAGAGSDS